MALYELAENCEYDDFKDEMIRDRIVVGIRDGTLSERLQLDPELNLEKAKKAVRQREAVHEPNRTLTEATATSGIAALQPTKYPRRQRPSGGARSSSRPRYSGPPTSSAPKTCTRCGKEPHSHEHCPAKDAVCNKCSKKGHYGAVCRTKTSVTSELSGSPGPSDVAFLDNLTPEVPEKAWFTRIDLCECETTFKLDTEAEVTAINKNTYQHLGKPTLHTPDRILYGPSRLPLKVLGYFKGNFTQR